MRSTGLAVLGVSVDPLLQDRRRLEHHHTTRRDWHLGTSLRIATDALTLLADDEGAERRQLHGLAALQAVRDFLQHQFDERRGLRTRKTDLLVDGLAEVNPGNCLSRL